MWRVTLWLLAAVALLVVLHIVSLVVPRDIAIASLRTVLDDFNLDRENTVPAWFSSNLLLAGAVLMLGIGIRTRRRGERLAKRWILLGIVFVLLSLDESASLHEIAIYPVRDRLNLGGIFYWAWVVPAMVFVAFMAVIYIPFLFKLPRQVRWGMLAAAAIYLSGTLGMEMIGGLIASEQASQPSTADTPLWSRNLGYAATITIEESLEMLGLVTLLHALMTYAFVPQAATQPARVGAKQDRPQKYPTGAVAKLVPAGGSGRS